MLVHFITSFAYFFQSILINYSKLILKFLFLSDIIAKYFLYILNI